MEPKEKKAFEPTGLVPRSIVRTFERFRQQLLPGSETAAIREYRISRYQVLVSARCLFILLTIPIATSWLVSNWLLSPIIEHFWNTQQNEIFLNSYQEERAFAELEFFSEKLFFESLLNNIGSAVPVSVPVPVPTGKGKQALEGTNEYASKISIDYALRGIASASEVLDNTRESDLYIHPGSLNGTVNTFPKGTVDSAVPTGKQALKGTVNSAMTVNKKDNSSLSLTARIHFVNSAFEESQQKGEAIHFSPKDYFTLAASTFKPVNAFLMNNLPKGTGSSEGGRIHFSCDEPALVSTSQLARFSTAFPFRGLALASQSFQQSQNHWLFSKGDYQWHYSQSEYESKPLGLVPSYATFPQKVSLATPMNPEKQLKSKAAYNALSIRMTGPDCAMPLTSYPYGVPKVPLYSRFVAPIAADGTLPQQLTENVNSDSLKIKERVQEKILELAVYYNQQTILSITNVVGDLVSVFTLGCLFIWMRPEITILKSFLIEAIYSLSDTTKSFLLILLTDLLVGFHSPRGWETALELLLKHFGLPENQDFVFLFVATFPVLLDTVFKYWIFRHLNKISPSTVATYHSMIE